MKIAELTKEQWLKRCETIYDCIDGDLNLLDRAIDAIMRLEGGQMGYWAEFMQEEYKRTERFHEARTLANDKDLYNLLQLTAILNHPCQQCAEDSQAWWTRSAFCNHK